MHRSTLALVFMVRLLQLWLVMQTDRLPASRASEIIRGVSAVRTVNLFGAAILALSTSAYSFGAFAQDPAPATPPADTSTPAPDAKPAPKKAMHHKVSASKGKLAPTKAGDKAVEDLNDASLSAAKENKPFTPPPTPEAAKKEAHTGDKGAMKPMKHHMKKAAKKADTTAPATDAAPPADAPK
jgi:hypothetical protein